MQALVYTKPNQVELREIDDPVLKNGYAKIRVTYCGICGGDIGIFQGLHPRAKAPLIIGHEFIGTVESTQACMSGINQGDRVTAYPLLSCGRCRPCRTGMPHICQTLRLLGIDTDGGMAEYIYVHEDALFKVDDALSDRAAAVIEPLAVIIHSLHRVRFGYLETACVMGGGPIGLITAIALRHAGAAKIIMSDLDDARLALCRSMGFHTVNIKEQSLPEQVDQMTGGDGVDVTFECCGTESATVESTRVTRVGGTICMTGLHKKPHLVNLPELSFKEQEIVATRVYTKEEFSLAVKYAAVLQNDLEKVVSHIVPLKNADKVFEMIADPAVPTMKVLVDCTQS